MDGTLEAPCAARITQTKDGCLAEGKAGKAWNFGRQARRDLDKTSSACLFIYVRVFGICLFGDSHILTGDGETMQEVVV